MDGAQIQAISSRTVNPANPHALALVIACSGSVLAACGDELALTRRDC
jgi:hypothetical protein